MSIKSDRWIRRMAEQHGMIEPFEDRLLGGPVGAVDDVDERLDAAEDLDRLEPNPSRRPPVVVPRPLWPWPAALSLLCAAALLATRRSAS